MKLIAAQLNQVDGEHFATWATFGAASRPEAVGSKWISTCCWRLCQRWQACQGSAGCLTR